MDSVELLPLVMRWLHLIGASIMVGGTLFMYIALRGSLATLEPSVREAFRAAVMNRWKHVIAAAFVLLVVSGFYNYLMVTRLVHDEQPLYHALFGIKFLAALAAFALVFIVTSTMKWSEKLREQPAMWHLSALFVVAVLLIGGFMKLMPTN